MMPPRSLRKRYGTQEFLEATKGLNVIKAIYMEIGLEASRHVAEAEHAIALCESGDHPTIAAVVSGRPNSKQLKDFILRFKGNTYVKGARQTLHTPATKRGLCLEDQFVVSMRLLGEMNLSFDLCMRPAELSDASKLADRCPDTLFVLDHCGNADPKAFLPANLLGGVKPTHKAKNWRRDIGQLAKRKNIVCKISGIAASTTGKNSIAEQIAPIVNHCLDEFGPDRVVYGGDWPVCLLGGIYQRWLAALKQIISSRSDLDQRKLLHDNALKVYRLT